MFNAIAFVLSLATPAEPQTVITLSETVIVSAPAKHTTTCTTRDLVQGSGSVRTCERISR